MHENNTQQRGHTLPLLSSESTYYSYTVATLFQYQCLPDKNHSKQQRSDSTVASMSPLAFFRVTRGSLIQQRLVPALNGVFCTLFIAFSMQAASFSAFAASFLAFSACISVHRRLQSCVGTRARLGYAAFDVQLRKAYFAGPAYPGLQAPMFLWLSEPSHQPYAFAPLPFAASSVFFPVFAFPFPILLVFSSLPSLLKGASIQYWSAHEPFLSSVLCPVHSWED